MKQYEKIIKSIILVYILAVSISSCSDTSVAKQVDCYASDRYLLDNEYGELLWSISNIYVPYTGGNPMLATASGAVVAAVKSTIYSNGIAAYDLQTGRYIWGIRPVTPSILVADQNMVYEGGYEKIIMLDAMSGESVGEVSLPGVGNITSFYHKDNFFFVSGSSGRSAIYDLVKGTTSTTDVDFTKSMLLKQGNVTYSFESGITAKDENSGRVIWKWKPEVIEPVSDVVFFDDMIFVRTGESIFDGSLYAINKTDGSSVWKKISGVISNIDATDTGVYFLDSDGYLVVLNPQIGEKIIEMEFSARPFELRYSNQDLIGSYLIDVNQENGVIAISLGDSCQIMAIKIK